MPEFNIGDVVIIVTDDENALDYNNHLGIGTVGVVTELVTLSDTSSGLDVCVYFESPLDGYGPFDWWVHHSALSFAKGSILQDRVSNKIHKMFIRQPYYTKYIGG